MTDDGHHYQFGPPSKGWPDFDKDGKIVTPQERSEQHAHDCGICRAQRKES